MMANTSRNVNFGRWLLPAFVGLVASISSLLGLRTLGCEFTVNLEKGFVLIVFVMSSVCTYCLKQFQIKKLRENCSSEQICQQLPTTSATEHPATNLTSDSLPFNVLDLESKFNKRRHSYPLQLSEKINCAFRKLSNNSGTNSFISGADCNGHDESRFRAKKNKIEEYIRLQEIHTLNLDEVHEIIRKCVEDIGSSIKSLRSLTEKDISDNEDRLTENLKCLNSAVRAIGRSKEDQSNERKRISTHISQNLINCTEVSRGEKEEMPLSLKNHNLKQQHYSGIERDSKRSPDCMTTGKQQKADCNLLPASESASSSKHKIKSMSHDALYHLDDHSELHQQSKIVYLSQSGINKKASSSHYNSEKRTSDLHSNPIQIINEYGKLPETSHAPKLRDNERATRPLRSLSAWTSFDEAYFRLEKEFQQLSDINNFRTNGNEDLDASLPSSKGITSGVVLDPSKLDKELKEQGAHYLPGDRRSTSSEENSDGVISSSSDNTKNGIELADFSANQDMKKQSESSSSRLSEYEVKPPDLSKHDPESPKRDFEGISRSTSFDSNGPKQARKSIFKNSRFQFLGSRNDLTSEGSRTTFLSKIRSSFRNGLKNRRNNHELKY